MAKYKNQIDIYIDKPSSYQTFACYGKDEIANASKMLKFSGFRVWLYLLSNRSGEMWSISPQDANNKWGIPRTSFVDGMKELREKGFLDDKAIHSIPSDEIRQIDPKFVSKKDETRQNFDEIWGTNNITNKTMNNIKTNNASSINGRSQKEPIEEEFDF